MPRKKASKHLRRKAPGNKGLPADLTIYRNEPMNLNDPFGRMQTRRQKEYDSIRLSLQEAGMTNLADAQALLEKLRRRGIWGLAIITPAALLLALALPQLRVFILACGVLAAFWLIRTTLSSQEYVKRYIREELGEQSE